LQPRTKPVIGVEGGDQVDGEDGSAEEEGSEIAEISDADAKATLDRDMKELWGEKDSGGSRKPEDIVHYFQQRTQNQRVMLAERLVADVFRISKYKDAEVVADGWAAAKEQGVVSYEILKKGIASKMTTLDDESLDFPLAYKAMAVLMRSIGMPDDEIAALAKTIDAFEPPKPPEVRIKEALAAVDEDASEDA